MKVIRGVSITPDSVDIAYMDDSSDIRAEGAVYQVHTISIGRDDEDLLDELQDMETAVEALLAAGIRRWATTLPVTPEQVNERLQAQLELDLDDDDEEDSKEE